MTKARTLADNFAADINGITAGTGITGGGTSGTVTVTNSMATAIDAKGDLVVGTGADTFSRLAVASTAGYLLSVDSAEATGLKWAAPAASSITNGRSYVGTNQSTTSTSYTDLATTQSVTLTTGTKVLVLFNIGLYSNTVNQSAMASIAVSGATTTSASDDWALKLRNDGTYTAQDWIIGRSVLLTCTAGSNTFTLKFKSTSASATADFYNRELIVIDLGS